MDKLNLDWIEQVIAHRIVSDTEFCSIAGPHLNRSLFVDKKIGCIVDIVGKYFAKRKKIPTPDELKAYLNTNDLVKSYEHTLSLTSSINSLSINKDEMYANAQRFIRERGVYNTLLSVAREFGESAINTSEILERFSKTCNVNLIHDAGLNFFNQFDRVAEDLCKSDPVIPSGYKWLDERLGGGFQKNGRAMYVFAGETNIGKSIVLSNLAVNIAAQGKNVAIITLEMSELMYAKRLAAKISGIKTSRLGSDIDIVRAQVGDFKTKNDCGQIIVKEFPPSCKTPEDIEAFLISLVKQGISIDAIILDYINLLTSHVGSNSYEKVKHISEGTRAITYSLNAPLITVTQLNRTGYSVSEPGLTSMSESYALGATADFVSSLWQLDEDKALGIIRNTLLKNRFGPNTGTFPWKIDYGTLSITEDAGLQNETEEVHDTMAMLAKLSKS